MNTTTSGAIIRHLVTRLEDLLLEDQPERPLKLNRAPNPPLRGWIPAAGVSNVRRLFELGPDGRDRAGIQDPKANLVVADIRLLVAYPSDPKLWKLIEGYELDELIERDGIYIHDALFLSGGRANSAHQATDITGERVDKTFGPAWYLEVSATIAYYTPQRAR